MTTPRRLAIFLLAAVAWLPSCQPALGASLITATVSVSATPTNGATITVNGSTRTWVTNVTASDTQILIPAGGTGAVASNLWSHASTWEFPTSVVPGMPATNSVSLRTQLDGAMAASLSGAWGTITLATNTTGISLVTVRVPASGEPAPVRGFVADQLVQTIGDNANTNTFPAATPALANFVNRSTSQTIAGDKTLSGTTRTTGTLQASNVTVSGTVTGGTFSAPVLTNATVHATNGTITGVTISGTAGQISGGLLSGNTVSNATIAGTATGGTFSAPVLTNATVHATNGTITGVTVSGTAGQISGGLLSGNTVSNATMAGTMTGGNFTAPTLNMATVNATNGTLTGVTVSGTIGVMAGGVVSGSTVSNTTASGTTTVADLRLSRTTWAPTAGGNSGATINGSFARVTDPGGSFWVYGIAGGVDGRILVIAHPGPNAFTISYDSSVDGTAANRILTPSLGDLTSLGAATAVLVYDGAASRWRVVSWLD